MMCFFFSLSMMIFLTNESESCCEDNEWSNKFQI